MQILVVEDEPKAAAAIRKALAESGYAVDTCADGEEGLRLARSVQYSVVILDLMLPRRDGWSVLSELRRGGSHVPILVLTARDAVGERVRGLELGADDYLVKPFAIPELLARVRGLLRRGTRLRSSVVRVADLEVDEDRHCARRAGRELPLTRREFALLSLLAQHAGEPVSRARIADQVWGYGFDTGTNVVDVHIGNLRGKVDAGHGRKLIRTIRGIGYVLDAGD